MGKKSNRKNFLLLSMSTLHPNPSENFYQKGKFCCCGVGQLEPGTKYFLRALQKKETPEKLDGILIIASKEARARTVDFSSLSKYLPGIEWEEDKMSAVDFYKERIKQYILGREVPSGEGENRQLVKDVTAFNVQAGDFDYGYAEISDPDFFHCIPENAKLYDIENNENVIYKCATELCDYIKKKADGATVNLYVDMQGSMRSYTFILNAAVKILEIGDVGVKQSVATEFSDTSGRYNEIVDTTINDTIFEMVSGMNEFIKTGRGDTLDEFRKHAKFKAEKEIIDSIMSISDAISLCSVKGFDDGLVAFGAAAEKYDELDTKKFPMFQICLDELRKDYEEHHLLNGSNSKVLDQIKWCLDKKLYQQALTLIEAKVPDAMVDEKILYYGDEDMLAGFVKELKDKELIFNLPTYVLCDHDTKIKQGQEKYVFIKYAILFQKNGIRFSVPVPLKIRNFGKFDRSADIKTEDRGPWMGKNKKIARLLAFYHCLCELRNTANHAVEEREIDDQIRTALDMFWGKKVDGDSISKNLDILISKFLDDFTEMQQTEDEIKGLDLSIYFPLESDD